MRRKTGVRLVLAGLMLAGCHRPYFMTEADYTYYNRISGDYSTRGRFDDIDSMAGRQAPNVVDLANRQDWPLSLQEAKHLALAANKRIAVLGFTTGEAGTRIDTALSAFDAQILFGGVWARSEQQTSNVAQGSSGAFVQDAFGPTFNAPIQSITSGGATDSQGLPAVDVFNISKRNATGGISSFGYDLNYTRNNPTGFSSVNPAWNNNLKFSLAQPLLQGAGVEFNRAPILIARAGMEQSIKDFDAQVRTLLRDVENAYWQLYFTYQDVYSRKVGLELGLVLWQTAVDKRDNGKGTEADVAQGREQYESFKASLINSQTQLLNAERELRRLMGMPAYDCYRIVPSDNPTEAQYLPNMCAAIHEAMELRPELASQRFQVRSAELTLMREKNGLLPDLTVFASYGLNGLETQYDQSLTNLFSNRYTSWQLGFRFQRAIGERGANAATRNAQLALSRQRHRLAELEHETIHELYSGFNEVTRSFTVIEIQHQRRNAAAVQLSARRAEFQEGKTTFDVLSRALSAFADALRDEAQAIVQYNQALAAWEFSKGTILLNDNVALAEELCTNVPEAVRARVFKELTDAKPLPIHKGGPVKPDTTECPDTSLPLYKVAPTDVSPMGIPLPLGGAAVNLQDGPLPPPSAQPRGPTTTTEQNAQQSAPPSTDKPTLPPNQLAPSPPNEVGPAQKERQRDVPVTPPTGPLPTPGAPPGGSGRIERAKEDAPIIRTSATLPVEPAPVKFTAATPPETEPSATSASQKPAHSPESQVDDDLKGWKSGRKPN